MAITALYSAASGLRALSTQIDVIANNLANADTTGFKRDIASFKQRLTEQQEGRRTGGWSDPDLEGLGGGTLVPLVFVSFRVRRRAKAFENQLPDLLATLAASLKAGHSFKHGLQAIVDEGQPPARAVG